MAYYKNNCLSIQHYDYTTDLSRTYESGIASYKHVYFNATRNTGKIWSLTALCVIALYEAVRRLAVLLLNNRLRHSMLILFLSSIFSHYYSWWSFFNYWNDDFYSQWNHQLFFSLTELFSTLIVLRLADSRESVRPFKVLPIVAVAATHIVASSWDQFLDNVVRGEGSAHQALAKQLLTSRRRLGETVKPRHKYRIHPVCHKALAKQLLTSRRRLGETVKPRHKYRIHPVCHKALAKQLLTSRRRLGETVKPRHKYRIHPVCHKALAKQLLTSRRRLGETVKPRHKNRKTQIRFLPQNLN
ncbi:hypothetical protein J6590_075038 [Homalodisca vitripennis]|nr:hypothetical protein J6590_075038 [Homalodisca vitripennis]